MITLNWTDFKAIVDSKQLNIQYKETATNYLVYAVDHIEYECILVKNATTRRIIGMDATAEAADVTDFETNYKDTANDRVSQLVQLPAQQQFASGENVTRVYQTTKDPNDTIYFCGKDDDLSPDTGDTGVCEGTNEIILKCEAGDTSDEVELKFNTIIHIKEGFVSIIDAPLGAYLDVYVTHPADSSIVLKRFVHIPILGTCTMQFVTEDYSTLAVGVGIRIKITNSSGTGKDDAPGLFKAAGHLTIFRATTAN